MEQQMIAKKKLNNKWLQVSSMKKRVDFQIWAIYGFVAVKNKNIIWKMP